MTIDEQLKQFENDLETPQETLGWLTSIQFAAKHGKLEFIAEQLGTKDPRDQLRILGQQTKQGGFTALHYATYFGHVSCVKTLLELGASLHSVTLLQMKPIQLALTGNKNNRAKQIQLFELLNRAPLALSHPNMNGDTLAHLAAEFDLHEVLAVIDDANLNIKNQQGLTPLLISLLNNSMNAVSQLSKTASIKEKDFKQRNALHYATLYSAPACMAHIVPYFENDVPDQDGYRALDYASRNKDTKKVEILTAAFPKSTKDSKSS